MRVICTDYDQLLAAAKMAGNDDASIGERTRDHQLSLPN